MGVPPNGESCWPTQTGRWSHYFGLAGPGSENQLRKTAAESSHGRPLTLAVFRPETPSSSRPLSTIAGRMRNLMPDAVFHVPTAVARRRDPRSPVSVPGARAIDAALAKLIQEAVGDANQGPK